MKEEKSSFEKMSARRKELVELGEVPDWYTTQGLQMFEKKYSYNNETVKGAFKRISNAIGEHYTPDKELAKLKFMRLLWKGNLGPSTPVMANSGTERGQTVSCAGSYMEDSIHGFYSAHLENAVLSQEGYGTSSYMGDIRPRGSLISRGGKASGSVPIFQDAIRVASTVSQGGVRRGQWAGYTDMGHGDFWELQGYVQKNSSEANIGYNFTDEFIELLKQDDPEAVKRWDEWLFTRCKTGKGYMWKPDTANRRTTQAIKNSGIPIKGSNLCVEIALPQDCLHTFTCVISSLNLANWDNFDDDTIYWALIFLDCVVSDMLEQAKGVRGMENAVRFTEKARALGLGVMGYHTYLQKKMIAFESFEAHMLNMQIFKKIQSESERASRDLAALLGEPEWCKGLGVRNSTWTTIPPTMSSALLCGSVSQGIEPIVANAFNQNTAAGEMTRMNPELIRVLKQKGEYNLELMDDIAINHSGSVQHLEFLDDNEKAIFKTAFEIDQMAVLRKASARSPFICQWQSLNLFFSADEDEEYIAEIHKTALLDEKILGLYYLRSERGVKASKNSCVACE